MFAKERFKHYYFLLSKLNDQPTQILLCKSDSMVSSLSKFEFRTKSPVKPSDSVYMVFSSSSDYVTLSVRPFVPFF